ncbi:MAG: hypothetical protein SNJ53_09145, partial [Thermodesulfovibrionales bacterium]
MKNSKGVTIQTIPQRSVLYELGVRAGDSIVSVDDNRIGDIIDLMFYSADVPRVLKIKRDMDTFIVNIPSDCETDIFYGVGFQP